MRIVPYERPVTAYERAINRLVLIGYTVPYAAWAFNQLTEAGWRANDIVRDLSTDTQGIRNSLQRIAEEYERNLDLVPTEQYDDQEEGEIDEDQPMMDVAVADGPPDRHYAATVRRHSSTFGHKKRYTLKKVKHVLTQNQFVIKSRFQTFGDYATGVGGRSINMTTPLPDQHTRDGLFPFHIWDVTSMYGAADHLYAKVPIRGYQLAFRVFNAETKEYNTFGWLPMQNTQNSVGNMIKYNDGTRWTGYNVAVPVESTAAIGANKTFPTSSFKVPWATGFTHNWSDIQMVLYPQKNLPVKWHVALISFPDDLVNSAESNPGIEDLQTAGPGLNFFANFQNDKPTVLGEHSVNSAYDPRRQVDDTAASDLSLRWQKFWAGKLDNPINKDNAAVGTINPSDNRLPFKIIKHESFVQPNRDKPEFGGKAQRLIKKLFYRREWEFAPRGQVAQQFTQGDAVYNLSEVQVHKNYNAGASGNTTHLGHSGPYPKDSEIVYLAIWCESFTRQNSPASLDGLVTDLAQGTDNYPSYDLMVRMKHTLAHNEAGAVDYVPQPSPAFAPTKLLDPGDDPQPPAAPIKRKRNPKVINASETIQEGSEVS